MSRILHEDFARVAQEYDFSALAGSSVLVTGATGLLGSQLVRFLLHLSRERGMEIRPVALVRSEEKAARVFGDDVRDMTLVRGDVLRLPEIPGKIDHVIHGASVTSSKDFISRAVETIDIAVNGTLNVLRLAGDKGVRSLVYLSSMEAFGVTDGRGEVREEDLGYIDIASPRSSYMESKRMCENLCASFASEYGLDAKSVRLAQTLGAGIAYDDTRVAAYFARCVIEGTDIVLRTEGRTKRPVLYSSDAVSAILTVMLRGGSGGVYTAANPATFATIRETAEMVAREIAGGRIVVRYDIQDTPAEYAPNLNLNLNLNVDKLRSLGWRPSVGLRDAYGRMIAAMREEKSEG